MHTQMLYNIHLHTYKHIILHPHPPPRAHPPIRKKTSKGRQEELMTDYRALRGNTSRCSFWWDRKRRICWGQTECPWGVRVRAPQKAKPSSLLPVVWRDSFMCVTRLICIVSRRICQCDMTSSSNMTNLPKTKSTSLMSTSVARL